MNDLDIYTRLIHGFGIQTDYLENVQFRVFYATYGVVCALHVYPKSMRHKAMEDYEADSQGVIEKTLSENESQISICTLYAATLLQDDSEPAIYDPEIKDDFLKRYRALNS